MYGKHLWEEHREKLSNAQKGRHVSPETRKLMSEAQMGEKNHRYGKHLTEEQRLKISEAQKGKYVSPETRKLMSEAKSKSYLITSPEGENFVIRNMSKFCREMGLNKGSMSSVATGRYTHHKQFKCSYIDE